MQIWKTGLASAIIAAGLITTQTQALAGTIRIGATMRMVSDNGQKYGRMVADEFKLINAAGGHYRPRSSK